MALLGSLSKPLVSRVVYKNENSSMWIFKTSILLICVITANSSPLADQAIAQELFHQPYRTDYVTACNDCFDENSILPQATTWTSQPATQPIGESYFQNNSNPDNPWFIRLGVGVLLFGEGSTIRANGQAIPGAGLDISDATTFAFDIGYQLSPVWSATLSGGVPARLDLTGTGPLANVPLGTTLFAPIALTLQRHFFVTQRTSIYVGGGINYNAQYESRDDFIQNLDIDNDAAVVLQLGVERRINNRISLFADAKKAFYRTQAFGNIGVAGGGSVPVRADVTVNPTILVFGLKYDF